MQLVSKEEKRVVEDIFQLIFDVKFDASLLRLKVKRKDDWKRIRNQYQGWRSSLIKFHKEAFEN